jgi:hypothetical protein
MVYLCSNESIFIDEIRANKNKTFIDINSIIIADDNLILTKIVLTTRYLKKNLIL